MMGRLFSEPLIVAVSVRHIVISVCVAGEWFVINDLISKTIKLKGSVATENHYRLSPTPFMDPFYVSSVTRCFRLSICRSTSF